MRILNRISTRAVQEMSKKKTLQLKLVVVETSDAKRKLPKFVFLRFSKIYLKSMWLLLNLFRATSTK